MLLALPKRGRPNAWYKKCALGVDLPASFVHELRGLDEHLYPVWNAYQLLWDSIINTDAGAIEDSRYQVESKYGHTNFGFVLTDGQGRPREDGHWHIYRWCEYAPGWAHILKLESSNDQIYLNLVVKSLYLQDQYNRKFRGRGYSRMLEDMDAAKRHKMIEESRLLQKDILDNNKHIMGRVMDNFSRGVTKPTKPKRDIIMSGPGLSNRSKITREVTDVEGGLILPAGYGEE